MSRRVIRAFAIATVATIALAACTNQRGVVPSSPSATAPTTARSPAPALKTCATSPPQYEWIFKGACQKFDLTSDGGRFSLGEYQNIAVKGFVGKTTALGSVKIALASAIDSSGDVETYKGKSFRRYKGRGITYFYAAAVNQSAQTIKPVVIRGKPVFQFTVTDANGFGDATICGDAVLHFNNGKPSWDPMPGTSKVNAQTVTLTQYGVPNGFELPPKTPIYFAVNCYKKSP